MNALQSFMLQLESTYTDLQWSCVREREAQRLGIEAPEWASIRSMNVDLVMVREVHRCVSERAVVRRADRDGDWGLSPAHPGKLRSQPQSFRIGAHVEPAWDHVTLRRRMAELVNATRDAARGDSVSVVGRFLRSVARAQPFVGQNEQVALVAASSILRAQTLPAFHVNALVHDRQFEDAVVANDDDAMVEVVESALWTEALALAEWLPPAPAHTRWTLADEHAAASSRRASIDLTIFVDDLLPLLRSGVRIIQRDSFAERAAAATQAVHRGHSICPHHTIVELRWELDRELEGVLVLALPGRGITGAASAHVSIEHPHVVRSGQAPAILLPIEEAAADRISRLRKWIPTAMRKVG